MSLRQKPLRRLPAGGPDTTTGHLWASVWKGDETLDHLLRQGLSTQHVKADTLIFGVPYFSSSNYAKRTKALKTLQGVGIINLVLLNYLGWT